MTDATKKIDIDSLIKVAMDPTVDLKHWMNALSEASTPKQEVPPPPAKLEPIQDPAEASSDVDEEFLHELLGMPLDELEEVCLGGNDDTLSDATDDSTRGSGDSKYFEQEQEIHRRTEDMVADFKKRCLRYAVLRAKIINKHATGLGEEVRPGAFVFPEHCVQCDGLGIRKVAISMEYDVKEKRMRFKREALDISSSWEGHIMHIAECDKERAMALNRGGVEAVRQNIMKRAQVMKLTESDRIILRAALPGAAEAVRAEVTRDPILPGGQKLYKDLQEVSKKANEQVCRVARFLSSDELAAAMKEERGVVQNIKGGSKRKRTGPGMAPNKLARMEAHKRSYRSTKPGRCAGRASEAVPEINGTLLCCCGAPELNASTYITDQTIEAHLGLLGTICPEALRPFLKHGLRLKFRALERASEV
jgi:hypothetical protein